MSGHPGCRAVRARPAAAQWIPAGQLPAALVDAAAASTGSGMVLVAGDAGNMAAGAVLKISLQGDKTVVTRLPALPYPVREAVAAISGSSSSHGREDRCRMRNWRTPSRRCTCSGGAPAAM